MAPSHYWTDPCGLNLADYLTIVVLVLHITHAAFDQLHAKHAMYFQRIVWARQALFASTGDRISQIQNFRSKLMVLGSMIAFAGYGATTMAQMAVVQHDEFAKIRALVPFTVFTFSICGFGLVGATMFFSQFITLAHSEKKGCASGCIHVCKTGSHPKTNHLSWDADGVSRICSLAVDSARAFSVSWYALRIGLVFMLWPFDAFVAMVLGIIMLFVIRVSDLKPVTKKKWTMKELALTDFYQDLLRQRAMERNGNNSGLNTPTVLGTSPGSALVAPPVLHMRGFSNASMEDGPGSQQHQQSMGSSARTED